MSNLRNGDFCQHFQNHDHSLKKGLLWMKICNIISQDVYYENEYHLFNLFFPKSGPKLLHFFLE